jgi:hypothetical protein
VSGAGTSSADVTADGGTSANTGTGAAGDGAAEKPAADARLDPDIEFDPAAIHIEAQIATLRAAAAAHVPFCEACERTRVAQQASSASPS